jgi:hypothetical protein
MDIIEAHKNAILCADEALKKSLVDTGHGYCGFAWVKTVADGRSSVVKELKKIGFEKSYNEKGYYLWCPANSNTQSMTAKIAACKAYIEYMYVNTGIHLFVESRMD